MCGIRATNVFHLHQETILLEDKYFECNWKQTGRAPKVSTHLFATEQRSESIECPCVNNGRSKVKTLLWSRQTRERTSPLCGDMLHRGSSVSLRRERNSIRSDRPATCRCGTVTVSKRRRPRVGYGPTWWYGIARLLHCEQSKEHGLSKNFN